MDNAPMQSDIAIMCRAICKSGRFETGEGTCSLLCMEFLGSPRDAGCMHAQHIHNSLAMRIRDALVLADRMKVQP